MGWQKGYCAGVEYSGVLIKFCAKGGGKLKTNLYYSHTNFTRYGRQAIESN
jgi:hypothetical protein